MCLRPIRHSILLSWPIRMELHLKVSRRSSPLLEYFRSNNRQDWIENASMKYKIPRDSSVKCQAVMKIMNGGIANYQRACEPILQMLTIYNTLLNTKALGCSSHMHQADLEDFLVVPVISIK